MGVLPWAGGKGGQGLLGEGKGGQGLLGFREGGRSGERSEH